MGPERQQGRRRAGAWVAAALGLYVAAVLGLAFAVPLPERLAAGHSTVVTYRDGRLAHVFVAPDGRYRIPVSVDEVDPDFVRALLRFEDKRFFWHGGVDPLAVLRAAWLNLRRGRVVSGGSTLTLQLVRVLEPRPRTLRSKVVEALRAAQLELRMSKEEILSAYLTYAPYGQNVEGVEAAAWAYFGHGADALSADEIATLLAVPMQPAARHPAPENEARLRVARDAIAARLAAQGALVREVGGRAVADAALLEAVRAAPVPRRMRPVPREAIHAAEWLHRRHPGALRIETTLDRGVQRQVEQVLARARRAALAAGIHNAAVVVVDHTRFEVRALAGNFDYWDRAHGGQITGFDVARSPGSALKPFIFALAVDDGLVLPETRVPDVPQHYGGYAPQNYDGTFSGLVTLEEALSRSRNLPFVDLLAQVGVERFVGTLRQAGLSHLVDRPGYYGLSAAIGSVEVTPLEMAGLYAMLAEGGAMRPLAVTREEAAAARKPLSLLSPGACYLTRRILALRDRPDFPRRRRYARIPPAIHWKTGTSYGHRDAWAVGSGPVHTVAVWLGNFDNRPSAALVGAPAAGPLLFDLLEGLRDPTKPPPPDVPPPDLKPVELCAFSGRLPTPACPHRRTALARVEAVPIERCAWHRRIEVDRRTGEAVGPGCRSGRLTETRTYTVLPARVRRYLTGRLRALPQPPPLASGCRRPERTPPVIVSPAPGQVTLLLPGLDASAQELPLFADADAGETLAWFVDGRYLGSVPADQRLWWTPVPGHHEVLVMDESGRAARRRFLVRARSY